MIELSDEILCKYLDGELDADSIAQVDRALAADSGARVRLERMRSADALLRQAIPEPSASTDDPLAELIRTGTAPIGAVSRGAANATANSRRAVFVGALAAGIAGLVAGALLVQRSPSNPLGAESVAAIDADSAVSIASALDRIASGSALQRKEDTVRMILSFQSRDGRNCRVFEIANGKSGAEGVACKGEKQWQVVAWDATHAPTSGFRAAGASELVDGVMNRLGGNAALESADEQKLIERDWRQ
jgi:hypothetical protein